MPRKTYPTIYGKCRYCGDEVLIECATCFEVLLRPDEMHNCPAGDNPRQETIQICDTCDRDEMTDSEEEGVEDENP